MHTFCKRISIFFSRNKFNRKKTTVWEFSFCKQFFFLRHYQILRALLFNPFGDTLVAEILFWISAKRNVFFLHLIMPQKEKLFTERKFPDIRCFMIKFLCAKKNTDSLTERVHIFLSLFPPFSQKLFHFLKFNEGYKGINWGHSLSSPRLLTSLKFSKSVHTGHLPIN